MIMKVHARTKRCRVAEWYQINDIYRIRTLTYLQFYEGRVQTSRGESKNYICNYGRQIEHSEHATEQDLHNAKDGKQCP